MKWVSRIPLGLLAFASGAHVVLLGWVFSQRLFWPLDLEWMEGGQLTHALRLLGGESIYGPPTADFIPFLYTPLHPWLLSLLGEVFGLGYGLGRGFSIASFALLSILVWQAVRLEGGAPIWRLAACGALAAAFPLVDGFYDLVRADTLFVALTLAGLLTLRHKHDRAIGVAVGALLLALAFLAKQTAAPFVVAAACALLLQAPRRLPLYVGVIAIVDGGLTLVLDARTDGWFWATIFELHQAHDFFPERLLVDAPRYFLQHAPLLSLLPFAWVAIALATRSARGGSAYWAFMALVGVGASAISWSTQWASLNAFMPGFVLLAVFLGVAGADFARRLSGLTSQELGIGALTLAVALQLAALGWSPAAHVPTPADDERAERLLELLSGLALRGDVLVPYHPWYAVLVGSSPHFHHMGVRDFTRAGLPAPADLRAGLADRRWAAVVLDQPPDRRYGPALQRYRSQPIPERSAPMTFEGFLLRPRWVLVPDPGSAPDPGSSPATDPDPPAGL